MKFLFEFLRRSCFLIVAVALGYLFVLVYLHLWQAATSMERRAFLIASAFVTHTPLLYGWSKFWIGLNRRKACDNDSNRQIVISTSSSEKESIESLIKQINSRLDTIGMMKSEAQNGYITHKDFTTIYLPLIIAMLGVVIAAATLNQ